MHAKVVIVLRAVIVSCLIVAVVACGDKSRSDSARAQNSAAATKTDASATTSADMVGAVSTGKSSVPVEVRFDHAQRPELGVPLDLVVSILPTAPVNRIQVVFQAQDGLRITANSNLGPIERPTVGNEIRHVVTVTPLTEGVYSVAAVVLVETSDVSVSRSFAMPLVVTPAAPSEDAEPRAAGATDASGSEKGAQSP